MNWTRVLSLYLIGVLGSSAALLFVYGGGNPTRGWTILAMAGWPWVQMVLVLTLVSLALPWPLAATVQNRKRFDEGVIAVPWLLGPAAYFLSHPGPEALGRWSDPAALGASGLVSLAQLFVVVGSGRQAWTVVNPPRLTEHAAATDAPRVTDERFPFPVRDLHPSGGELGTTEIGWDQGELTDGRPFLAECWADTGMTAVTFFFSWIGIENATEDELAQMLEEAGLVRWLEGPRKVSAKPVLDEAENRLWSASVVAGVGDTTLIDDSLSLKPYPRLTSSG